MNLLSRWVRAGRLHRHAHAGTAGNCVQLLPHGVDLYLVHCRHDGGVVCNMMQMIRGEIRYSDTEHLNRKVSKTGGKGG